MLNSGDSEGLTSNFFFPFVPSLLAQSAATSSWTVLGIKRLLERRRVELEIGYSLVSFDYPEIVRIHCGFFVAHLKIRLASTSRIDKTSSVGIAGRSESIRIVQIILFQKNYYSEDSETAIGLGLPVISSIPRLFHRSRVII
ncbi:hypothetical protein PanWU01x14_088110 [Parasponia andersonii]|uniref:Uncharacterized protein n=1 Tax=Parasponia andersonii TaxID=3476 RepID=A0A2P5D7U7_PARAD|nr:hypothetical protein PanWU01x14_088110 [Parasponia andersonii]